LLLLARCSAPRSSIASSSRSAADAASVENFAGGGLKRLFSLQALANFAKGLAKSVIFGAVITALLWPQRHRLAGLVTADPALILPFTVAHHADAGHGGGDRHCRGGRLPVQHRQWYGGSNRARMKEEFRQAKAIRWSGASSVSCARRARKHMMAAVPTASVIITNRPTLPSLLTAAAAAPPLCVARASI
jgi:flagellar biosynthetic protein FlhB